MDYDPNRIDMSRLDFEIFVNSRTSRSDAQWQGAAIQVEVRSPRVHVERAR